MGAVPGSFPAEHRVGGGEEPDVQNPGPARPRPWGQGQLQCQFTWTAAPLKKKKERKKESKGICIGLKEMKLSLFTEDTIVHVDNPMESIKKEKSRTEKFT